jgi:hypothetical protein
MESTRLANLSDAFRRLGWILSSGHLTACPVCRGDYAYTDNLAPRESVKAAYDIMWDSMARGAECATCPVCLADVSGLVAVENDYDYEDGRYRDCSTYSVNSNGDYTPLRPGLPADLVALHAERHNGPVSKLAWEVARDDFEGMCTADSSAKLAALKAVAA